MRFALALEVIGDLRLHRIDDHGDKQVQDHERCDEQVDHEEDPGKWRLFHHAARNIGPAFHRHHLEQREHRLAEMAEVVRRNGTEQFRGHDCRHVEHERHQADDRRHAR